MPFFVYTRMQPGGEWVKKGQFKLAGYGLLYQAWETRNQPIDEGWEVSAEELVQIHSHNQYTTDTMRLIIQWANNNPHALMELLHVYAYTWGTEDSSAEWTPLMLRLRRVDIQALPTNDGDLVEFLYLKGEDAGFNFGRVGMVNAPFIEREAREYFRQFF